MLCVLATCNSFNCLPSDLLSIHAPYTKYCFNEACMYLKKRIEEDETPHFEVSKEEKRANPLLQKMLSGAF